MFEINLESLEDMPGIYWFWPIAAWSSAFWYQLPGPELQQLSVNGEQGLQEATSTSQRAKSGTPLILSMSPFKTRVWAPDIEMR